MEMTMRMGAFEALDQNELYATDGGGAVAFVYAMGFAFGCTPLTACIAAGAGVVALGAGIYCGVTGKG